jgi:hypothetical protein
LCSTQTTAKTGDSGAGTTRSGTSYQADIEGAEAAKRARSAKAQFIELICDIEQYTKDAKHQADTWTKYTWKDTESATKAQEKLELLQQAIEGYEEALTGTYEYKDEQIGKRRTVEERKKDSEAYQHIWNNLALVKSIADKNIKELKELANMPEETSVGSIGKITAKIPTPSKFTGKPSECTTAWLRQWKQQVEDYFYLTQMTDTGQQMIFLPNCLEDGAKKFYYGFRALHGPRIQSSAGKEEQETTEERKGDQWNLTAFFKALKEVYIPVNHVQDQMDE